jgi:hypothetical protein
MRRTGLEAVVDFQPRGAVGSHARCLGWVSVWRLGPGFPMGVGDRRCLALHIWVVRVCMRKRERESVCVRVPLCLTRKMNHNTTFKMEKKERHNALPLPRRQTPLPTTTTAATTRQQLHQPHHHTQQEEHGEATTHCHSHDVGSRFPLNRQNASASSRLTHVTGSCASPGGYVRGVPSALRLQFLSQFSSLAAGFHPLASRNSFILAFVTRNLSM